MNLGNIWKTLLKECSRAGLIGIIVTIGLTAVGIPAVISHTAGNAAEHMADSAISHYVGPDQAQGGASTQGGSGTNAK